jgi:hypothetical protein
MKYHNFEFRRYKPKVVNDLIRVGNKEKDGGYVLSQRQVAATKVLMGLGINYDWTFEADFKNQNKDVSIYCYDFSVGKSVYLKSFVSSVINVISPNSYTKEILNKRSPLPVFVRPFSILGTYFGFSSFFKPEKGNYFFQKGISDSGSEIFITVPEMFKTVHNFNDLPENSVYIKMDIEQSEYDILEDLLEHSAKINGIAIEFHDLKHFWGDFKILLEKLGKDFEIIHIHGNNCCGYIPGTEIPNFIEITYMKRNLLSPEELKAINNQKYPLEGLDKPNLPNKSDMKLPF